MQRRKFLRTAGVGGATIAAAGTLAAPAIAQSMPEIKWRLLPSDVQELHGRQLVLLRNALQALAPRGVLVYSTCSLEREENEGVIEALSGLHPAHIMHRIPGLQPGDGFFAAVIRSR